MTVRSRVRGQLSRVPGALPLVRLLLETIRVCLRYRVTGLASEAGFFTLLSLPPLVLGLFGGVGYIGPLLGPGTVHQVTTAIETYALRFLTDQSVTQVVVPTMDDVLHNGRFDIISVGFVFSLWSGSRALNVFVDTISIMYGQSGVRHCRGGQPHFALSRQHAEMFPLAPRRAGCGPHAAHLAPDVVLAASVPERDRGRYVHLWAAGCSDRRTDLVVLSGVRDPHRGGAQPQGAISGRSTSG